MEVGSNPPETLNSPNLDGDPVTGHHSSHRDSHNPIQSRSGQILWIRGLTRLQTQIRVVNAFRQGVDSSQIQQAASNQNIQRVLQRQASLGKRSSIISNSVVTEENSAKVNTAVTAGSNGNTSTKVSSSHTETAV